MHRTTVAWHGTVVTARCSIVVITTEVRWIGEPFVTKNKFNLRQSKQGRDKNNEDFPT